MANSMLVLRDDGYSLIDQAGEVHLCTSTSDVKEDSLFDLRLLRCLRSELGLDIYGNRIGATKKRRWRLPTY